VRDAQLRKRRFRVSARSLRLSSPPHAELLEACALSKQPIANDDTFDFLVVEMAHFPMKRSKSDFRTFIQAEAGRPQILSLIHTSDFCRLQGIQEANSLTGLPDSRFNDDRLLYFFYGRPSYRVNPAVSNTRVSSFAPISFVFKKDLIWNAARLHPFDTGAFIDKRNDNNNSL
jgi:hypothetical protein